MRGGLRSALIFDGSAVALPDGHGVKLLSSGEKGHVVCAHCRFSACRDPQGRHARAPCGASSPPPPCAVRVACAEHKAQHHLRGLVRSVSGSRMLKTRGGVLVFESIQKNTFYLHVSNFKTCFILLEPCLRSFSGSRFYDPRSGWNPLRARTDVPLPWMVAEAGERTLSSPSALGSSAAVKTGSGRTVPRTRAPGVMCRCCLGERLFAFQPAGPGRRACGGEASFE